MKRRAPPRTTTGAPSLLLSTGDRPRLTQFVHQSSLLRQTASAPGGSSVERRRDGAPVFVRGGTRLFKLAGTPAGRPVGQAANHPPGGNSSLHLGLLPSPTSLGLEDLFQVMGKFMKNITLLNIWISFQLSRNLPTLIRGLPCSLQPKVTPIKRRGTVIQIVLCAPLSPPNIPLRVLG